MYLLEERNEVYNDDGSETGAGDVHNDVHQTEKTKGDNHGGNHRIDRGFRSEIIDKRRAAERSGAWKG